MAAPAAASGGHSAYLLQFGAFQEPANAARMQAVLKKYGYAAGIVPFTTSGKVLQLVQIGGFADRNAAAQVGANLQRDTGIDALVMKSTSR